MLAVPYNIYITNSTVCPRSLCPFCIVSYYIKWDKTSWTDSIMFYCLSKK